MLLIKSVVVLSAIPTLRELVPGDVPIVPAVSFKKYCAPTVRPERPETTPLTANKPEAAALMLAVAKPIKLVYD